MREKKTKTFFLGRSAFFHTEIAENPKLLIAIMFLYAFQLAYIILRNFHGDAVIPVVKLFWCVAPDPTINSKYKPGQSQSALLKLESVAYTRGEGAFGGQPLTLTIKKMKTSLFGTIRFFSYRDCRNCYQLSCCCVPSNLFI